MSESAAPSDPPETDHVVQTSAPPQPQAPAIDTVGLPPAVHQLKSECAGFMNVWDGRQTHELRYDDRGFRVDDLLLLREGWMPDLPDAVGTPIVWKYTGRYLAAEITHITSCARWMGANAAGFKVLSIRVLSRGAMPPR